MVTYHIIASNSSYNDAMSRIGWEKLTRKDTQELLKMGQWGFINSCDGLTNI